MARGGKRRGSGRPKGTTGIKQQATITKEQAREAVRVLVLQQMQPMVQAQITNALGLRHTFMRDDSGRFVQLTDPQRIADALNSGEEGKYYWTFTKDPSIQAFTDLMNRSLDKPKEQEQELSVKGDVDVLVRKLASARKRGQR